MGGISFRGGVYLRQLLRNRPCLSSCVPIPSSYLNETLIFSERKISSSATPSLFGLFAPFTTSTTSTPAPFSQHLLCNRTLSSSSSSSGPSNIVLVKSEEEFSNSLSKAQDKSLPAIFYFTAVWCGPCRFISPVIGELSEKYPHVTTYKIDIDEEGLGSVLSKLNITAVPTLHFFQDGKKVSEIIGSDVAGLKDTMERLYG